MAQEPKLSGEPEQARRTLVRLATVGTTIVVLGAIIYFSSDRASYGGDRRTYICDQNHEGDTVQPVLWLFWIALVALAVWASTGYRRHLRGHASSRTLMRLGVAAAALTCPVLAIFAVVMDCGL